MVLGKDLAMTAQVAVRHQANAAPMTARDMIHDLARQHAIRYERGELDDWAETVSRVAGDDIQLDETEWLLVALGRAEVMPEIENTKLHARYLAERDGPDM
jgi:hypothetical protein